jgi:hypothetical protein
LYGEVSKICPREDRKSPIAAKISAFSDSSYSESTARSIAAHCREKAYTDSPAGKFCGDNTVPLSAAQAEIARRTRARNAGYGQGFLNNRIGIFPHDFTIWSTVKKTGSIAP